MSTDYSSKYNLFCRDNKKFNLWKNDKLTYRHVIQQFENSDNEIQPINK